MNEVDEYTVRFRFRLEQDVKITALKLTGRVIGRCEKVNQFPSYEVVWWSDSVRRDEWLFEFELGDGDEKERPTARI
jgi:hypothetical protein